MNRWCAAALLFAVLSASCGPYDVQEVLPKKPGQQEAISLIVQELQTLTGHRLPDPWMLPEVRWHEGDELNCGCGWLRDYRLKDDGTCRYGMATGGRCVACLRGSADFDLNEIEAAWCPGVQKYYHQTSLAHEHCHYFELWTTGDGDSDHLGRCFMPMTGWVAQVNRSLEAAGL